MQSRLRSSLTIAIALAVAPAVARAQATSRVSGERLTAAAAFGGLSGAANLNDAGSADWRLGWAASVNATYWVHPLIGLRASGNWAQDSVRSATIVGRGKFNKFAYDAGLVVRYPVAAGTGTFIPYLLGGARAIRVHQLDSDSTWTGALASLLPGGRVYAVDQNARSLSKLNNQRQRGAATIIPVVADFTRPLDLPGLGGAELDGLLFANSLHFVADPATALGALAARVRTGGRIVIVEYDRRAASRWVPYPIPANRLPALAKAVGLTELTIVASRASSFGGILYVATASRLS